MDKEYQDAKEFIESLNVQVGDKEPPFFDVVTATINEEWCQWYAINCKGDPSHVLGMALVKMLVLKTHLDKMIEIYWEEESDIALLIIEKNKQLWPLLYLLNPPKPKRFQWLRKLFRRT